MVFGRVALHEAQIFGEERVERFQPLGLGPQPLPGAKAAGQYKRDKDLSRLPDRVSS